MGCGLGREPFTARGFKAALSAATHTKRTSNHSLSVSPAMQYPHCSQVGRSYLGCLSTGPDYILSSFETAHRHLVVEPPNRRPGPLQRWELGFKFGCGSGSGSGSGPLTQKSRGFATCTTLLCIGRQPPRAALFPAGPGTAGAPQPLPGDLLAAEAPPPPVEGPAVLQNLRRGAG
jgi:hypothetical protein